MFKTHCDGAVAAFLDAYGSAAQAGADVGAFDHILLALELKRIIGLHDPGLDVTQDRWQVVSLLQWPMQKAAQIDPLSRMYQLDNGMCLYKRRFFDEALALLGKARELDPKWPIFDITEAMMEAGKKDWPRALESARRAKAAVGSIPFVLAIEATAEAGAGNPTGAKARLAQLTQDSKKGYVPAFAFALASYASGESAVGYKWLRRAFEEHNGAMMWLGTSPMFDIVLEDPRAAELLKHIGDRAYVPKA